MDDVETYVFRAGDAVLLALQRDQLPRDGADLAEPIVLTLPRPSFVYDILGRENLGQMDRLELTLDRAEPTLLALADASLPSAIVSAPSRLRLGETGLLQLTRPSSSTAAFHVLHVEVTDPRGRLMRQYSGNVIATDETATHALPLALNDPVGTWGIEVTDVLSGQTTVSELEVVTR